MKNKVSKIRYSICIATYNRAEFLFDAIRSAVNQVYKNFEVIIVNDGSTDNTREIAASFISDNVHYFEKPHSGAPETRNMALDHAKGEFIVWLGDDDILLPGALSFYEIYLKKYKDADILYCYLKSFSEDPRKDRIITPSDWYNDQQGAMGHLVSGSPITDGGCAVRRIVYEMIGSYNPEFKRAQDYEFWSRVIPSGKFRYKLVDKVLYLYRIHERNITGKADSGNIDFSYEARILNSLLSSNPIEDLFPKLDWKNQRLNSLMDAYYFLVLKFLYIKQIEEGICYLEKINEIEPLDEMKSKSLLAYAKSNYDEKTACEIGRILSAGFSNAADKYSGGSPVAVEYNNVLRKVEEEQYSDAMQLLNDILTSYDDKILTPAIDLENALDLAGNLALLLGNTPLARTYFERALRNYPSSPRACLGLGKVLLMEEDLNSSKTMLQWAIKLGPELAEAAVYLRKVNVALGLNEDDISEQEVEDLPDKAGAGLIELAEKLLAENRTAEAEDILQSILKDNPHDVDALNNMAVLEILKNNYNRALQFINIVLDIDPENLQAVENVKILNEILNSGSRR